MSQLRIIPLGGLGEIGLNSMVFEYGDHGFLVDAGLMFPEDHMLGVDYVIPNFQYLKESPRRIIGIVLTHAHEDHIGALPYVLRDFQVPVFGTPFTLGMVRHKLEEHAIAASVALHEVGPGQSLHLGNFEIDFIEVCHSVVDAVALAIRCPAGLCIHSGDFKINHSRSASMVTDVESLKRYGDEGVLALLSDSTNVEKPGYTMADEDVGQNLAQIVSRSKGRIIVALFASSINRIQQVIDAAAALDRKVVINGRSIETSTRLAHQLGHLRIPAGIEIPIDEIGWYPDDEVLIITTGSQGEPMAAMSRMAAGTHKQINIKSGDTVVLSSKFIPGNERNIFRIINNLYRQGAEVVYEKISTIHVSGHAFREELKLMLRLARPEYFIPIHGEYRHLVHHARLAEQVGVSPEKIMLTENGSVIEIQPNGARLAEKIPTGRVLIDGKGIGDVGRSVLRERRVLAEDGLVVVNMAFDEETGVVVYGPELVSRGFVFENETGHLLEDAKCVVLEIVESIGPEVPNRVDRIRARSLEALRIYFNFAIRRRPVILPFIQEI